MSAAGAWILLAAWSAGIVALVVDAFVVMAKTRALKHRRRGRR